MRTLPLLAFALASIPARAAENVLFDPRTAVWRDAAESRDTGPPLSALARGAAGRTYVAPDGSDWVLVLRRR